jgi:hypothetical protein
MVPQIIEDYVGKVADKTVHPERRQFYVDTLRKIKIEVDKALLAFEKETKKR